MIKKIKKRVNINKVKEGGMVPFKNDGIIKGSDLKTLCKYNNKPIYIYVKIFDTYVLICKKEISKHIDEETYYNGYNNLKAILINGVNIKSYQ